MLIGTAVTRVSPAQVPAAVPRGTRSKPIFVAFAFLTQALYTRLGASVLLWTAVGVFVAAWIAQFIGHEIEGKRPSFLTDLQYLLIGPIWLVSKALRHYGVAY